MAKFVITAEFVSINGTDLSDYCNKGELSFEVDEKDVTTFGSEGWTELLGGLKSGTLAIEAKQDFADGALDATMFPLLGTVVDFEVRPTSAAASASNPSYSGSVLISGWNPIQGGVGDEASVSVSYPTSGPVARATA